MLCCSDFSHNFLIEIDIPFDECALRTITELYKRQLHTITHPFPYRNKNAHHFYDSLYGLVAIRIDIYVGFRFFTVPQFIANDQPNTKKARNKTQKKEFIYFF